MLRLFYSSHWFDIVDNSNTSSISIFPVSPRTYVKGTNTAIIMEGKGQLDKVILESAPGDTNVEFILKSTAIDYELVRTVNPIAYPDQILKANFRWWMPGQVEFETVCSPCSPGTYSVLWNATECLNCPEKAAWEEEKISLNKGYWRIDANSTTIIECPNQDAWLGGFNPGNEHPVNWKEGYRGILCNEWVMEGDQKYERIADNTCSRCPDYTMNLIRIILVSILFLLFLFLLIR